MVHMRRTIATPSLPRIWQAENKRLWVPGGFSDLEGLDWICGLAVEVSLCLSYN